MKKTLILSQLALLAVSLIFAANYWVSKSLMPVYLDPFQLLIIRTSGALVIIWILQLFFKRERVSYNDIILFALCGFFGIALNQGLFFIGLNKTSALDASIIHTSNPIIVMLIAALFIKEKITFLKSLGIFMGLSGALFLILTGNHIGNSSGTLVGNLLIFINGTSYAIYLVMVKPLMQKYHTITVLKWIFLFGFLFSFPFIKGSHQNVNWETFSAWQYTSLLYIIIFNSFIAYFLIVYALKHVTATIAGYYTYLQPLVVAIIGIIIGSEVPGLIKIVAGLMIFTGVYLINKRTN